MATIETAEDRLVALRDRLQDLDVRARVPELLEDLEPASREARIKGWELVRWLVGALLVLPRLLVRLLGALPKVVEEATEQGGELAERARGAASSIPSVRRHRRHQRTQLIAWTVGGFAAGAVTGWLVARRQAPPVTYEATAGAVDEYPVPSVNGTSSVSSDAAVRE